MGKYVQRMVHKNKRILFLNAAGVEEEEAVAACGELQDELLKEQEAASSWSTPRASRWRQGQRTKQ